MQAADVQPRATESYRPALGLAAWTIAAAFGAYFCTYAFRKPFTAATFAGGTVWGMEDKTALVTAQVLGYMASKFLGIRVIAEMPPRWRAAGILALIGAAQAALVLFGMAPRPLHVACLFLNGLTLGMVYGLILGFLEGRRSTEALTAGLCTSFILADGVTKSVGASLLQRGATERWMPCLAGLIFLPPLLLFVWMLTRIPPPDADDVAQRSERLPMAFGDRVALLRRYGVGLSAIVATFLLVTILRSIRSDFAPEIWRGLGVEATPATFATSEVLVAIGVLVANGLSVLIADNRRAFFTSIGVSLAGILLIIAALVGLHFSWLGGFPFVVAVGLGLYLPYVAVHTTILERLIAMTRGRGNLGFLMYVADSAGYLGYVVLMTGKGWVPERWEIVPFFVTTCWVAALLSCACLATSWLYFARRSPE